MSVTSLLDSLAREEVVIPYLNKAIQAQEWPDSYDITVDSRKYTGTGDGYFHPSSHTNASELFLFFALHPELKKTRQEEKRSISQHMTLSMGSALHAVAQTQLKIAGLITEDQIEVPLSDEEIGARGKADWIMDHPNQKRYLCDLKTQNTNSFDRQNLPKESWVGQLSMYAKWAGVEECVVLVMESGYPYRMKEFVFKRDDMALNKIYAKWRRVREHIANDTIPDGVCNHGGYGNGDSCVFRHFHPEVRTS